MNNLAPVNDINLKVFDQICEERFGSLNLKVLDINDVDKLPADVLPHLAEQYHITGNEGWKFCKNEQEKRTLIKNALKLHKYRGTKYAIIKALEVIDLKADIEEWFEYNGSPYFFKVLLDTETNYTQEVELQIFDLINENKNARSWLEKLDVNLNTKAEIPFLTYMTSYEEVVI